MSSLSTFTQIVDANEMIDYFNWRPNDKNYASLKLEGFYGIFLATKALKNMWSSIISIFR